MEKTDIEVTESPVDPAHAECEAIIEDLKQQRDRATLRTELARLQLVLVAVRDLLAHHAQQQPRYPNDVEYCKCGSPWPCFIAVVVEHVNPMSIQRRVSELGTQLKALSH